MKHTAFVAILFAVFGCGEQSESESPGSAGEAYTPAAPISYYADLYGREGIAFTQDAKVLFEDAPADWSGYNFSASNLPSWMSMDASAQLSGTPDQNGHFGTISIVATKPFAPDYSASFTLAVNGDPLRKYAWHLNNTGQTTFANWPGSSTYSINADPVYARGITGQNIRVAVSDTGVEINHDDLYQNSLSGEHKNYTSKSPYYGIPTAADFHGTSVSSLIAGKGWNNEGSMGVAPDALFAGFQFLYSSQSSSILIDQANGDFDIFNYSYGDYLNHDTLSDLSYIDHLRSMVISGRGGLGVFYVKAAGNEFYSGDGSVRCTSHNANAPYENESPFLIVTGAINADGERSTYSNAGSNLWVSAPGGEHGSTHPAILAADLPTCFKGLSKATSYPYNDFEYGHLLNPKCNYTSTMNGTSAAAPITSGVIALILDANPNLSWREVKHILAVTAQKVDPTSAAWPNLQHPSTEISGCDDLSLAGHEYEQGWVTNAAGYSFHNYYGFGLIDADAAVEMALNAPPSLPGFIETNPDFDVAGYKASPGSSIPDANATGVTSSIAVSVGPGINSGFVAESVQVKVQVTHPFSGEVGVELTSPSGTKSIMLNTNNSFLEPSCDDNGNNCAFDRNLYITLNSNAFYGESAIGTWTLKVIDGLAGNTGTLDSWSLNILGHNP